MGKTYRRRVMSKRKSKRHSRRHSKRHSKRIYSKKRKSKKRRYRRQSSRRFKEKNYKNKMRGGQLPNFKIEDENDFVKKEIECERNDNPLECKKDLQVYTCNKNLNKCNKDKDEYEGGSACESEKDKCLQYVADTYCKQKRNNCKNDCDNNKSDYCEVNCDIENCNMQEMKERKKRKKRKTVYQY